MVPEYVDHLLSGCTPLAATLYKQRHDRLANIVHWSILKRFNQPVSNNYWDHALLLLWRVPKLKFYGILIFILTMY